MDVGEDEPIIAVAAAGTTSGKTGRMISPREQISIVRWAGSIGIDRSTNCVACNNTFVAIACNEGKIAVWPVSECDTKPKMILTGHVKNVQSMQLGSKFLLCSASTDKVIIWRLDNILSSASNQTIIGSNIGLVEHIAFSKNDELVGLSIQCSVVVFNVQRNLTVMQLDGHGCSVRALLFSRHLKDTLISVSEDRTFKVWSIATQSIVYKSPIISASPFICVTEDPSLPRFVVASSDGQLRFFDEQDSFQCISTVNIPFLLKKRISKKSKTEEPDGEFKIISSEPIWKQQEDYMMKKCSPIGRVENSEPDISHGDPILHLEHLSFHLPKSAAHSTVLVIGTFRRFIVLNTSSYEILFEQELRDGVEQKKETGAAYAILPIMRENTARMFVASTFNQCILVYDFNLESLVNQELQSTRMENNLAITIFANQPLPLSLSCALTNPSSSKSSQQNKLTCESRKKKNISDKPVTFHSKVKSTGYGKEKPFMFPKTKPLKEQKLKRFVQEITYNCSSDPPSIFTEKDNLKSKIHNGPILSLSYCRDGSRILSSSTDYSARMIKQPISKSKGEGCTFVGHQNAVTFATWSNDSQLVLTSSMDGTACMWKVGRNDPLMQFKNVQTNCSKQPMKPSSAKGAYLSNSSKLLFNGAVQNAQFYYRDKFVLLANGNSIFLYRYRIKPESEDQILKKQLIVHKYKLLKQHQSASQTISAVACVNSFLSNLIVIGGSNKKVDLYDVCAEKVVSTTEDAHGRAIHTISLQEISPVIDYNPITSSQLQLYLTSATDNTVKMWDIRCSGCVRRFQSHKNGIVTVGCELSPCTRFLATGSEDRCAYLYDVKSGSILSKLQGHADTVSDVSFHPCYPQIATSSYDGSIRFYGTT